MSVERRQFLQNSSLGFGWLALSSMLAKGAVTPHFKPRAKNVIFLLLFGGPSQLETFDLKPDSASNLRGPFGPIACRTPDLRISECLPQLANVSNKFCVVRT
ncbi:MAG: DUF1501 domain-containing protein, partial [Planctomycetes bacterium]|nr:DUF1501 domain-containing protein [Planctomycetota bacterium]